MVGSGYFGGLKGVGKNISFGEFEKRKKLIKLEL